MTAQNISHQRDIVRDTLSKEFSRTIREVENALKQLRHHWDAFNQGDDIEKADRAIFACEDFRRSVSHIDIASLASKAASLEVLARIEEE